jgi:hypothetical protein
MLVIAFPVVVPVVAFVVPVVAFAFSYLLVVAFHVVVVVVAFAFSYLLVVAFHVVVVVVAVVVVVLCPHHPHCHRPHCHLPHCHLPHCHCPHCHRPQSHRPHCHRYDFREIYSTVILPVELLQFVAIQSIYQNAERKKNKHFPSFDLNKKALWSIYNKNITKN